MATRRDFVTFLEDQLRDVCPVEARAMFGEYALYHSGKLVALVCDDRVFVKPTAAARRLLPDAEEAPPYPGARPHVVVGAVVEDAARFGQLLRETAAELPAPKPRRKA